MLPDHVSVELGALALGLDGASSHHDILLRQARGEMEPLLHQQNGKPTGLFKPDDDVLNLIDDRRLDTFSRFIQQQQFGAREDGPSDRELLLLPSTEDTPRPVQNLCQLWKQLIDLVECVLFRDIAADGRTVPVP